MKIATPLALVSSLLIVAGCAHHEGSGQSSESYYSPAYGSARTSTYSSGGTATSANSSQTTVNQPATTYQTPAPSTTDQAQTANPTGRIYHESKTESSTTVADT